MDSWPNTRLHLKRWNTAVNVVASQQKEFSATPATCTTALSRSPLKAGRARAGPVQTQPTAFQTQQAPWRP